MMNSQSLMAECMAANVRSLLYMKALKLMKASNERLEESALVKCGLAASSRSGSAVLSGKARPEHDTSLSAGYAEAHQFLSFILA